MRNVDTCEQCMKKEEIVDDVKLVALKSAVKSQYLTIRISLGSVG